jgi:deoxyribodipyrimidine photolyase-related protein
MSTAFLIFPPQLFASNKALLGKYDDVFILEEPTFFYDPEYKPFKPNKVKLAYLRACMKCHHSTVLKGKAQYIEYNSIIHSDKSGQKSKSSYDFLDKYTQVSFYDPIDHDLMKKMNKVLHQHTVLPSPDFLLPPESITQYYNAPKASLRHAPFYEFVKKELDVLKNVPNLDKLNRNRPPKQEPHIYKYTIPKRLVAYYNEAIEYVDRTFTTDDGYYGNVQSVKLYPISHNTATAALGRFIHIALPKFGEYQDAIMQNDPFMYHAIISPMLNVGLLTPQQVIKETLQRGAEAPLSSLEGFLRQILGWRTMMQSLYIHHHESLITSNTPKNYNKFRDPAVWYTGETGILPIDEEIKKAQKYGYSHHIVRLMILLNFFILCELHPYEIYKWFMEVVSIDAYSWVMESNIYAMGYFNPKVMTKPYLSTSNYVLKMTNYKRDGHWDKLWDALYHDFVSTKPKEYTFFYKRTLKDTPQPELLKMARDFKANNFVRY